VSDLTTLVASVTDSYGIDQILWDGESLRIITVGLLGGKITIYDLTNGKCHVVKGTKTIEKGHSFNRKLGILACLIMNDQSKETLSLVSVNQAKTLLSFSLDTKVTDEVMFGADDSWLIVRERFFSGSIYVYGFDGKLIYTLSSGGSFTSMKNTPGRSYLITVSNSNQFVIYNGRCFQKISNRTLKQFFKEETLFNLYEEFALKEELTSEDILKKKRGKLKRFYFQFIRCKRNFGQKLQLRRQSQKLFYKLF
jgi:WD40 repeat protein